MVAGESFRGWRRPGPLPPGGVEPDEGETLEYISGHFKIFQYERGHRYSTDDVLTAWYGTSCAPRAERVLDLGSGIGSIALIAAWRLPAARFITVEAQEQSIRLARKSVRYNGLESRFTLQHGDLRDRELLAGEAPFDLVFGSPPYWPPGTAVEAEHSQAVAARFETRGNLADYAAAAARSLAPGGVFTFVAPLNASIGAAPLVMLRRREVIFKEGRPPIIALGLAGRREDYPASLQTWVEPPLTIRTAEGEITDEYSAIRLTFGFPPRVSDE